MKRANGFTIVELLIVIVVIGILAAISIVTYNGLQDRAHDASRRSGASNIAKIIGLIATERGADAIGIGSGCGSQGHGTGYYTGVYDPSKRIIDCLVDMGYPDAAKILDPNGCDVNGPSCHRSESRYMVVSCRKNGRPAAYALTRIKSEPQNASLMSELCDTGSVLGWADDARTWSGCADAVGNYCINHAVRAY